MVLDMEEEGSFEVIFLLCLFCSIISFSSCSMSSLNGFVKEWDHYVARVSTVLELTVQFHGSGIDIIGIGAEGMDAIDHTVNDTADETRRVTGVRRYIKV